MVYFTPQELGPDEGKRIPPGQYEVVVMSAKEKPSRAGDDMWEMQLSVVAPESVGGQRTAGFSGLFDYIVFAEPSGPKPEEAGEAQEKWKKRATMARMWREKATALGLVAEAGKPFQAHSRDVVGMHAIADVIDDNYEGQLKSKIKRLRPMDRMSPRNEAAASPIATPPVDYSNVPF